jgi:hypothetical protein
MTSLVLPTRSCTLELYANRSFNRRFCKYIGLRFCLKKICSAVIRTNDTTVGVSNSCTICFSKKINFWFAKWENSCETVHHAQ